MCSFREGQKPKAGLKADILEIHPLCLLSANARHLWVVRGRGKKKKAIFMRAVNSRQAGWAWINLFSHSCLDKVSCHWNHNRNSQLLFQEAEIAVPWAFWSTAVAAGLAGLSCALTLHWPCPVTSSAPFKAKYVFLLSPKWRTGADAYHPSSCDQMPFVVVIKKFKCYFWSLRCFCKKNKTVTAFVTSQQWEILWFCREAVVIVVFSSSTNNVNRQHFEGKFVKIVFIFSEVPNGLFTHVFDICVF